jgi:hypothetical protein
MGSRTRANRVAIADHFFYTKRPMTVPEWVVLSARSTSGARSQERSGHRLHSQVIESA